MKAVSVLRRQQEKAIVFFISFTKFCNSITNFDIDWRGIKSLIAQGTNQDISCFVHQHDKWIFQCGFRITNFPTQRTTYKSDLVYIKADKGDQGEKKAEELKAVKKELLELCTETAQKFLVQGTTQVLMFAAGRRTYTCFSCMTEAESSQNEVEDLRCIDRDVP